MTVDLFDSRQCVLGEGPLWHPERDQLFWFDILGKRMMSREESGPLVWQFTSQISAAGWISADELLIASESSLFRFNVVTGVSDPLVDLEKFNTVTRSNDGRADPWGGFWIGTMGKSAEQGAGAIYRFFKGEVTPLFQGLTIPNSICFAPNKRFAYFADSLTSQIMRQKLGTDGWPVGAPEVFVDLRAEGLVPDGAVVDAEGCLWNAQWGASRVARYSPEGKFLSAIEFPATQISCPAFGGENLTTLYATSAATELVGATEGQTFKSLQAISGQKEYQILL